MWWTKVGVIGGTLYGVGSPIFIVGYMFGGEAFWFSKLLFTPALYTFVFFFRMTHNVGGAALLHALSWILIGLGLSYLVHRVQVFHRFTQTK